MKKFLINIILFGLFSLIFYVLIMPLWSSFLPFYMSKNVRSCMGCYGHTFTRMKEVSEVDNIDVLIVGSSHAYRGIDPRILNKYGIRAFNIGSSAQTPINTNMLLNQYLDVVKPKLVIYEVYAGTLEIEGLESTLDLLSNNKIDYHSAEMAFQLNKLVGYNTLLFSTFRQLTGLNNKFSEPSKQADDTYITGTGYVQTNFRKNKVKKEKSSRWNIDERQLNALKKNVELIKSKGIDLYLIQTPISKTLYNSKSNNNQIDSIMMSLGRYKNYQHTLELNDTIDFYDNNHMNHDLVVTLTEILSKDLNGKNNGSNTQ